ncbi:MAG TPA: hypothetical protein VGE41_09940 [Verrucomicrobiae bacterium]
MQLKAVPEANLPAAPATGDDSQGSKAEGLTTQSDSFAKAMDDALEQSGPADTVSSGTGAEKGQSRILPAKPASQQTRSAVSQSKEAVLQNAKTLNVLTKPAEVLIEDPEEEKKPEPAKQDNPTTNQLVCILPNLIEPPLPQIEAKAIQLASGVSIEQSDDILGNEELGVEQKGGAVVNIGNDSVTSGAKRVTKQILQNTSAAQPLNKILGPLPISIPAKALISHAKEMQLEPEKHVVEAKNVPVKLPDGTGVAKTAPWMKKAEETGNLDAKKVETTAPAAILESDSAGTTAPSSREKVENGSTANAEKISSYAANSQSVQGLVEIAPTHEESRIAATAPLERLQEGILHSAMELKRVQMDSMSVVLKPDTKTELHLQLSLQNGRVDVEARLDKGNVERFRSDWHLLQQTLAAHDIHLRPMDATPRDPSGNQSQQNAREKFAGDSAPQSKKDNDQQTKFFEEFLSGSVNLFPKPAGTRRFWESWA